MATNAERAQIARINRLLEGQMLRKTREDSRWFAQLGPYSIVDISTNTLAAYPIDDLDALEAELIADREKADTSSQFGRSAELGATS